jgi:hypothetical protein
MVRVNRVFGVVLVAGLLAAACAAWADLAVGGGRPGAFELLAAKNAKAKQPKGPPPAMVTQGFFGDDIDKIDTTCELTDAQKTKLRQMKTEFDTAMEKYDNSAAPKLAKIDDALAKLGSNTKDPKTAGARKELDALKARIAADRENLSQSHTRRMFAVLTADQKAKWNTPLLTDEMAKEFSVVSLDAKQIEKLSAFCAQQARALTFPVDPFNSADKQLNAVKMQVYRTILTSAQQAEYRQIKNPPPPPAKTVKGKA